MVLPLVIDPKVLEAHLGDPGLLLVDLCRVDLYDRFHLPGAIHLDYSLLTSGIEPAVGDIPDDERLSELFTLLGLTPTTHVVAYDDEGGGKAARLLWTLDVIGHPHASLLDGGIVAWVNEKHPLEEGEVSPRLRRCRVAAGTRGYAAMADVIEALGRDDCVLVDTRAHDEFTGRKRYALRGGHIPGAVHIDWLELMDEARNLRLRRDHELHALFVTRGVTAEKEVVVYCQSHHRAALAYVVLRHLGYPHVRGYAGAWSEWGNNLDVPVEPD